MHAVPPPPRCLHLAPQRRCAVARRLGRQHKRRTTCTTASATTTSSSEATASSEATSFSEATATTCHRRNTAVGAAGCVGGAAGPLRQLPTSNATTTATSPAAPSPVGPRVARGGGGCRWRLDSTGYGRRRSRGRGGCGRGTQGGGKAGLWRRRRLWRRLLRWRRCGRRCCALVRARQPRVAAPTRRARQRGRQRRGGGGGGPRRVGWRVGGGRRSGASFVP